MFTRVIELIGSDNLEILKKVSCLVVGLGGVGATCVESLVRSGIGNLTITDYDKIELSNLNRQIMTDSTNLGKKKTEECFKRFKKINPEVNLKVLDIFLDKDNLDLLEQYDYIIDACDTVKTKLLLMEYAYQNKIKIISCMGTGKRLDPSKLKISTLNKTYNDPLAKVIRSLAKKNNLPLDIPVVFSEELPINNNKIIGSMMMVPSSAGLLISSYIIKDILKNK